MARKTGKDVEIHIEVGTTYYPLQALSSVTGSNVRKNFLFGTAFVSGQENLEPDVRLDGVLSGGSMSPVTDRDDAVTVNAFDCYIKGVEISVAATEVRNIPRPTSAGNVLISAICCDENGAVSVTAGTEGSAGGARGAAGGLPYIPVDQICLGYITLSDVYASGSSTITAAEINTENKERSDIPAYTIDFYDSDEGYGLVKFGTALETIHGAGADYRNVYASWYSPTFEVFPETYDAELPEDMSEITSRAYGDAYEQKATDIPSWNASWNFYWSKVKDLIDVVKNSKRWIKIFPDKDDTQYWAGVAVIKATHSLPVSEIMNGSVEAGGDRALFSFRS